MSFVPCDDMLLKEIVNIQEKQGPDIGIQKIYDYMKAEHPLWMFGLKRLRAIRKMHNLAPNPPKTKGVLETRSESLKKANIPYSDILKERMHLTFEVSDGRQTYPYVFDKPFPRVFCETGFDRETTFAILDRTVGLCESEIIISRAWRCAYCDEPATWLYAPSPLVNLGARPPTVVCNWSRPLYRDHAECHELAHKESTDALNALRARGNVPTTVGSPEESVFQGHSAGR